MTNLLRIQSQFNRASQSYEAAAAVQKQLAQELVEQVSLIKNFYPQTVLDLGTGTGYVPEFLMRIYPQSSYFLNDIAENMLAACKIKFKDHTNITYLQGDMATLDLNQLDLIISNFALQWTKDIKKMLEFLYNKSSSVFAFSTLLDGTFREWETIVTTYQPGITLGDYPRAADLIDFCLKLKRTTKFDYQVMDIPLSFNSAFAFLRYLKLLGASTSASQMKLTDFRRLIKAPPQSLIVSYRIFIGIFNKS